MDLSSNMNGDRSERGNEGINKMKITIFLETLLDMLNILNISSGWLFVDTLQCLLY